MTDVAAKAAALDTWLRSAALPLWWRVGADLLNGGFHEGLGLDGLPVDVDRRARVQARQVYVYAAAGKLGWDGPWREAVDHGLDFLLRRYVRPDGLIRTLVDARGAPADETVMVYDQAFALFALSAARAVSPDRADLVDRRSAQSGRRFHRIRRAALPVQSAHASAGGLSRLARYLQ